PLVAPKPLEAGWNEVEVVVPAGLVDPTLTEVRLEFGALFEVESLDLSGAPELQDTATGRTGVKSPVPIVVESAGLEVGDFAHIYVNGKDVAHNTIGYNVAVVSPHDGTVIGTAAFDTATDPFAAEGLAAFLDHVPEGF